MSSKTLRSAGIIMVAITVLLAAYLWYGNLYPTTSTPEIQTITRTFTLEELAQYNGTDSEKPIYLALNGLVYDVSGGREYYETGGSYHWLAGKDSSKDLNLIGGDIIKRKYPVIGKLVQ